MCPPPLTYEETIGSHRQNEEENPAQQNKFQSYASRLLLLIPAMGGKWLARPIATAFAALYRLFTLLMKPDAPFDSSDRSKNTREQA